MGRQVFTAGEILTAANMNDLGDATVMVFDDATARSTAIPTPVEGMVTYLKDTDSVEKFDGSNFVGVAEPPAILQVVSTAKTDVFSTTSGSFTDVTGLTASVTPTSTSNKVLVIAQLSCGISATNGAAAFYRLNGGGSDTYIGDSGAGTRTVFSLNQSDANYFRAIETASGSLVFLASPNTTSSVTFSVQAQVTSGATAFINRPGSGTIRGASSITVMEVAG